MASIDRHDKELDVYISSRWETGSSYAQSVKHCLEVIGYNVWLDYDEKEATQNHFETMQEILSKCHTFIMCISEGYESAEKCTAEYTLAYHLKKNIFPIMVCPYYPSLM